MVLGCEFWRKPATAAADGHNLRTSQASGPTGLPPIDLGQVMDRVTHAISIEPGSSVPIVRAETYAVHFDKGAIRVSAYRPATLPEPERPAAAMAIEERRMQRQSPPPQTLAADPELAGRFRTVSIRWANQPLLAADEPASGSSGDWLITGNTAQALRSQNPPIVEHYEARGEGIAVTWVLPERPPLHAVSPKLTIETELTGLTHLTQTEEGHHFADADGISRLRVGRAAAVDSTGRRWPLATTLIDDRMRIEVPEEILTAAAYPLAIDPVISPEFGVNQPMAVPIQGTTPTVASNGRTYLLAWQVAIRQLGKHDLSQIRATRISREGTILDPAGILVASGPYPRQYPCAASNGRDYFVSWSDSRDWDGGKSFVALIYGARISADGLVLDPEGQLLSQGVDWAGYVNAAAGNANGYFVIWDDVRNRGTNTIGIQDIYGTRVSSEGRVLDPLGVPVCTATNNQGMPALAANVDGFLAAWSDTRDKVFDPYTRWDAAIYAAFIGNDGVVRQTNGFLVNDGMWAQHSPSVAAHGNDFLVAWQDERNAEGPPWPGNDDIFGARVTAAGVVLDPNAIAITLSPGTQSTPAVVFDGSHWLVAWTDARNAVSSSSKLDIYAQRITPEGKIAEPIDQLIASNTSAATWPVLAVNQDDVLVAWPADREIFRPFLYGIMGTRWRDGLLLDREPQILSYQGAHQHSPSIAFNGSTYLVVWVGSRPPALYDNSTDIFGARVRSTGEIMDPAGLVISAVEDVEQYAPVAAANGTDFFVAWQDGRNGARDIYGTLVTGAGEVMANNGTPICTAPANQYTPMLAANGSQFLVAWMDFRAAADSHANINADVYATRIDANGAVLDPDGIAVCARTNDQYIGSVAANGTDWLVVWKDYRAVTNWPWGSQVFGARVAGNGKVLDPDGLLLSSDSQDPQSMAVASHGMEFLVAWVDLGPGRDSESEAVQGTRVGPNGAVLGQDSFHLADAGAGPRALRAVGTDDGYLVLWQADHSESDEEDDNAPPVVDVLGVRVRADGTVRDGVPLRLTPSPGLVPPTSIAGSGQQFLLAYATPTALGPLSVMASPLDLGLPRPWQEKAIGHEPDPGHAVFASQLVDVSGNGTGLQGRSDDFQFIYQPWSGDGQFIARFEGWRFPDVPGTSGLMMRESVAPNAKHVLVGFATSGELLFQRRKSTGDRSWLLQTPAGTAPWIKLVRQGSVFSAWTSQTGQDWSFFWVARLAMPESILIGFALAGGDSAAGVSAQFSNYQLSATPVVGPVDGDSTPWELQLGVNGPGFPTGPGSPNADDGLQLLVHGVPGVPVVLEGSSDLAHWDELVRFTSAPIPYDFEERLSSASARFYRSRRAP